jgi:nucleotide-binding universal stress UspA family protein
MFSFGSATAVEFLPDDDARAWIADGLRDLLGKLGEPATRPRLLLDAPITKPSSLDDLFTLMCGIQEEIGQEDIEFVLLEMDAAKPDIPSGFVPLGDPGGQLMHTFARKDELLVLAVPAIFRVQELVLASVARELGRIAIHRAGGHAVDPQDFEADAELAAVALGMGVWVANGSYVYENACCGGGCGIDLKSLRAGLSMPEACFALAIDAQRKGLSRRVAARQLDPTQKAAFKKSWSYVSGQPELRQLAAAPERAALG